MVFSEILFPPIFAPVITVAPCVSSMDNGVNSNPRFFNTEATHGFVTFSNLNEMSEAVFAFSFSVFLYIFSAFIPVIPLNTGFTFPK